MESNQEFINILEGFLFLDNHEGNIFRETLYKYSYPKLLKCMENSYFRSLAYHYFFELEGEEVDSDTRVGIQLLKRPEDFTEL